MVGVKIITAPDPTNIEQDSKILIPERFILEQNYPNPFNPTTAISFQLSANSDVTLKIYDLLGREVATLLNGRMSAGEDQIVWDARDFPSGRTFTRLLPEILKR